MSGEPRKVAEFYIETMKLIINKCEYTVTLVVFQWSGPILIIRFYTYTFHANTGVFMNISRIHTSVSLVYKYLLPHDCV